jgi:hypothetical protein
MRKYGVLSPSAHATTLIHPTHSEPEDGVAICTTETSEILKKPQRAKAQEQIEHEHGSL